MFTVSTLIDALFATRCVRCNRLGSSYCVGCWSQLAFRVRRVERVSPSGEVLVGFSVIVFDDTVSELMHEFKENGIAALAAPIGSALVPALQELATTTAVGPRDSVWLVPVASGVNSLQKRGYSPGALIGKALLSRANPRFEARVELGAFPRLFWGGSLVWRQREVADQAGLTGRARQNNLVGAMRASARAGNRSVVLVDDIVTTGSSLFETARALRAEGATVLGFVTFAETILRNLAKTNTET